MLSHLIGVHVEEVTTSDYDWEPQHNGKGPEIRTM